MRKLKFALLALAAGFMVQGAAVQPASALQVPKPAVAEKSVTPVGYRSHWRGGGHHYGHHYGYRHHNHWRHHYRPRIYIAPVYTYRSYGHSCRWLKRRALWTGSSYWWNRYNACRYGW